jgi:hypothetical protein
MTKFFFGTWATSSYVFAVAAAAVIMVGDNLATGHHEPSASAIYLIGLTAPVSVIFAPIFLLGDGWQTIPMLWLSVTAGLLLNTLLINTIVGEVGQLRRRASGGGALPVGQGAAGRLPAGGRVFGHPAAQVGIGGHQPARLGLGLHVQQDDAAGRRILPARRDQHAGPFQLADEGEMLVADRVDLVERREIGRNHQVHGGVPLHFTLADRA